MERDLLAAPSWGAPTTEPSTEQLPRKSSLKKRDNTTATRTTKSVTFALPTPEIGETNNQGVYSAAARNRFPRSRPLAAERRTPSMQPISNEDIQRYWDGPEQRIPGPYASRKKKKRSRERNNCVAELPEQNSKLGRIPEGVDADYEEIYLGDDDYRSWLAAESARAREVPAPSFRSGTTEEVQDMWWRNLVEIERESERLERKMSESRRLRLEEEAIEKEKEKEKKEREERERERERRKQEGSKFGKWLGGLMKGTKVEEEEEVGGSAAAAAAETSAFTSTATNFGEGTSTQAGMPAMPKKAYHMGMSKR